MTSQSNDYSLGEIVWPAKIMNLCHRGREGEQVLVGSGKDGFKSLQRVRIAARAERRIWARACVLWRRPCEPEYI